MGQNLQPSMLYLHCQVYCLYVGSQHNCNLAPRAPLVVFDHLLHHCWNIFGLLAACFFVSYFIVLSVHVIPQIHALTWNESSSTIDFDYSIIISVGLSMTAPLGRRSRWVWRRSRKCTYWFSLPTFTYSRLYAWRHQPSARGIIADFL